MVLVPANMSCFGFKPCNFYFFVVFDLCKLKNKIFCRDLFKKQNILQGLISTKWIQSSCVTYANHHKSEAKDYFKKQNILHGPKTTKKKLHELKPKRDIFAGTKIT